MNIKKLEQILKENNQPRFRLDQVIKAVFQEGVFSFSDISNLPQKLREVLDLELKILPFRSKEIIFAKDGLSGKALLELEDGLFLETVAMSLRPNIWSVCLSSQVGCQMRCSFCATGKMGFKRNLSSEEIFSQVLFWKQIFRQEKAVGKISNLVYMGMGEPFLNWPEVRKSLAVLTDEKYFNFGSRSISVSTVGVSGGIENLAREFPQINLAVSLHFSNDEKRKSHMPAGKIFGLKEIKKSLENYFLKSHRKVFLEYALIADLNDSAEDAKKLAEYVQSFSQKKLLHVNLIEYNETSGQFKKSPAKKSEQFKKILLRNRINFTQRKSLGEEIKGACGQLAGK